LKVTALFSGGKDSTYAAYLAEKRDSLECLVTLSPLRQDSYMFHYPNVWVTGLQAEAMDLPQVTMATEGIKEVELQDLIKALSLAKERFGIEGVYTGALASVYQKSRIDKICDGLGLESVSPLWHIDPETHLRNLLKNGFQVIVTSVSALGFGEGWLGRTIDGKVVEELLALHSKYGVHAGLEGGEGETLVLDCPIFEKRIELEESKKHWRGDSGYLEITKAKLVPK
jgi:diphthine-ammonia ligase